MGLLTNQYVSESYQGLLNLANPNTGLTTTLQSVTDGLGGTSPLQMSRTQINISGSLTINGSPVAATDTGSLMKTGSVAGDTLTFTKGDGSQFSLQVSVPTGSLPAGVVSGSQQIIDLGFLQTSSFNSYTSSNDSKVNSLIASTGSYATTSSLTSLSQSIASTDLSQDNRLTALEGVTGSINRNGLITTGSIGGNQSITGSVNVSNDITIQGSVLTDRISTESTNTLTLDQNAGGTLILGNNAATASLRGLLNLDSSKVVVNTGDIVGVTNVINLDTAGVSITGSIDIKGNITAESASFTYVNTVYETASVIYSSGSNQFGDASDDTQTLYGTVRLPNGPLDITGSLRTSGQIRTDNDLIVIGNVQTNNITNPGSAGDIAINSGLFKISLNGNTEVTGNLDVRNGNLDLTSNNTTIDNNLYLTNSLVGQSNIIKGWGDNPSPAGPGSVQSNYTGSLRITGSNNIVSLPQLRGSGFGGGTDSQGYISGSDNIIASNFAGIYLNTGSQLFPKTQNNILGNGSSIVMNFTTSSLAGGHPFITNNLIQGGTVTLNSNSGSITSFGTNIINGGAVVSTQNFPTNVRTLITQNNVNNTVTLNHISSSITYQSNINNSPVTINNHMSSSGIANNSLSFANNVVLGGSSNTGVGVWVSGSQSSNATRVITDNLLGGRNLIVSSSHVSSSNSNLISSLIYGQNLIVSGNHASAGGSTFVGRYNDATTLHSAQDIVFAVGTGTGTSNRRTGLYVTSGSLVGVSGSLVVTGAVNVSGGITGSLEGTASYATQALSASYAPDTTNTGSLVTNVALGLGNNIVDVTKGDGSTTSFTINNVTNATSASYAINADTASYYNGSVVSASFAENANTSSYARDIFLVGKNTTGGQLVQGTVVRIGGATGDQALIVTASWEDDNNSANTLGFLSQTLNNDESGSVITNGTFIGLNTSGMTAGDILYLSSSGQYTNVKPLAPYHEVRLGQVLRVQQNNGSAYVQIQNGYELEELHDVDITSPVSGDLLVYRSGSYGQWVNETGTEIGFATTGSNVFIGNQTITGSVDIRSGNLDLYSNNTTVNTDLYLTNSLAGQSNMFFGWGDNPAAGGPLATQANYTGSLRVTGSNNIISLPQARATGFGGGVDLQGYISGSGNMITTNNGGIFLNTGSLLFPKVQNNIVGGNGSSILMNFTTSSLAGGHPIISSNLIMGGGITLNSNSGSLNSAQNIVAGGIITSTQNFVTNVKPSVNANIVNGAVTLNHISSSINFNNNSVISPITVNNHLSSSNITNNSLTLANNALIGGSSNTPISIWVSGSQSSNATRNITDNLIGGKNIIISSSFVSSSNSNLVSSLIYGNALTVSGSHLAGTNGGSAFLGRFNDATSLHLAQDIVFAVGTGTGTSNRRTGLYIDSGSNVVTSGSFRSIGNATISGSLGVTGSIDTTSGSHTLRGTTNISGTLQVGPTNNEGVIRTLGGSNWLYRSTDTYNTIIGNVQGLNNGFFAGSEKNMVLNGFFSPFATGSNNVIIQGAGDDFISGSGNIFIGSHGSHAGGSNNILLGSTSYPSGSIFDNKFELGTNASSRIFHKQGTDPLQIGDDTQVTGSVSISTVMNLKAQDPLPAGNIGDLAVSSSNQLYFYNGAWTLIV